MNFSQGVLQNGRLNWNENKLFVVTSVRFDFLDIGVISGPFIWRSRSLTTTTARDGELDLFYDKLVW
jgi:hypothetical protein